MEQPIVVAALGALGAAIGVLWRELRELTAQERKCQATLASLEAELRINREQTQTMHAENKAILARIEAVATKSAEHNAPPISGG